MKVIAVIYNISIEPECNETSVRIVDGRTDDDGRIELCLDGLWGSVCIDSWDARDARVVCHQLGYDGCKITFCLIVVYNYTNVVVYIAQGFEVSSNSSIHWRYWLLWR